MNERINHIQKRQHGFGLLELMIALLLGLIVTGGVVQIFYSTNQAYRAQQAMSRVQESGRFALEMMKPELREAGRLDFCIADVEVQNLLDPAGVGYVDELFDPNQAILAWEFTGTAPGDTYPLPDPAAGSAAANDWNNVFGNPLPGIVANLAIPGSDVLLVKSADAIEGLTGCNNNNRNNSAININFKNANAACPPPAPTTQDEMDRALPQEGLVMVTDCSSGGDLFQRSNQTTASSISAGSGVAGGDPGNISPFNWSSTYGDTMQIYTVSSALFFVGVGASGEPSLFRWDFGRGGSGAVPEELIEGVESMQVQFGELLDLTGRMQYVQADAVVAPINVVAISISLLIRSPENADLEIDDQTYNLLNTTLDPIDDSRLRQVFTVTAGVRNRITGV